MTIDLKDINREELVKLTNTRREEQGIGIRQISEKLEISTLSAMMIIRGARLPSGKRSVKFIKGDACCV